MEKGFWGKCKMKMTFYSFWGYKFTKLLDTTSYPKLGVGSSPLSLRHPLDVEDGKNIWKITNYYRKMQWKQKI